MLFRSTAGECPALSDEREEPQPVSAPPTASPATTAVTQRKRRNDCGPVWMGFMAPLSAGRPRNTYLDDESTVEVPVSGYFCSVVGEQGADEFFRVERHEVADGLAEPHQLHRKPEFGLDGEHDATLR